MDFIMQLPMTKNGHDAILVFVDRLRKMAHFVPTRTEVGTNETAEIFMREVFRLHGLPKQIVSDRDGRFISRFWKEVCRLLGIQQGMSTAYHPQTDGQTERMNRVLEDMLRAYVNPMLNSWDEKLSAVEFAVNNAWQRSTKSTPFILNFGERPHTPTEIALNCKVPAAKKFAQDWHMTVAQARKLLEGAEQRCTSAEERQLQVDRAVKVAKDNITQAQSRQKLDADKRRSLEPSFDPGCDVLLNTRNLHWKHPGARKLLPLWIGPYKVVERVGKLAYKLKLAPEMKMHPMFHVSLLKKYDAHGRKVFSPSSHIISGVEMFEIEQIISFDPEKKCYLIKWLGYGHESNSWEPERSVKNCRGLVQEYWDFVRLRDQHKGTNTRLSEDTIKDSAGQKQALKRSLEQADAEVSPVRRSKRLKAKAQQH